MPEDNWHLFLFCFICSNELYNYKNSYGLLRNIRGLSKIATSHIAAILLRLIISNP